MTVLAAVDHTHNSTILVLAAVLGIAAVVLLITVLKMHPFLALILGSAVMGLVAEVSPGDTIASFLAGFGTTTGAVGLLVALGAMIGGLLTASGGADRVVTAIVDRVGPRTLPWAMAGVAALIAIPLFFEVGVVLLVPIVLLVALRSAQPVLRVGIPALAGLSVLHGFIPPHPGPLAAIASLKADLGLTLLFGLVLAIPSVIIAGPLFGSFISRRLHVAHPQFALAAAPARETVPAGAGGGPGSGTGPEHRVTGSVGAGPDDAGRAGTTDLGQAPAVGDAEPPRRQPAVGATVLTVLLPVLLMLGKAICDLTLDKGAGLRSTFDVLGNPPVALLIGVLVAMFTLGTAVGFGRERISQITGGSLPSIAGILLIVAAGGGFKQVLVDSGISGLIADAAKGASLSPLVLGWLVAVGIRLATGSATVATVTAAGIVAPLAAGLDQPTVALLVLAIGAGSLFFSHVNDAGFWLVKEYFGMSVGETLASWSVMETIISVVGLIGVLLLSLVV